MAQLVVLVGAGVVAGLVGSAGGITSLISYPMLLAVGIRPRPANVTNAVALVGSLTGSSLGSRPELRGQGAWLRRWAALVVVGSGVGVALLLLTPDQLFNRLVPFLLLLAAAVLLFQPLLTRWRARRPAAARQVLLPVGLFVIAVYSGYFGAGSGVMALALFMLTVDDTFALANARKNLVLGLADLVAAIAFLLFGPVHVWAALALGVGLTLGSFLGPSFTRRLPSDVIRLFAAALGVGLAIWLFVRPKG